MENTNRTRMEYISLLSITLGSKDFTISRARLEDALIHTNQVSSSIDIWGWGDQDIYFGSWKSCNEMSIYFVENINEDISMNPPRTIGSISKQITSLKSSTKIRRIRFRRNNNNSIPPRNIGSFNPFNRGMLIFFDKNASWHSTKKSEIENPKGESIKKMLGARIVLKLKFLGAKIL